MTTSPSSSDSDDDEFENEKNDRDVTETTKEGGNENDVDFLVREAMREEKLKLKSKLKEKKLTTVLPNGEDDDDDKGALNGANAKETEEEAMIGRLLKVERTDEPMEMVIHVNMLKEGWDVTNLYTIVPLRAANARILIEQSIGQKVVK